MKFSSFQIFPVNPLPKGYPLPEFSHFLWVPTYVFPVPQNFPVNPLPKRVPPLNFLLPNFSGKPPFRKGTPPAFFPFFKRAPLRFSVFGVKILMRNCAPVFDGVPPTGAGEGDDSGEGGGMGDAWLG